MKKKLKQKLQLQLNKKKTSVIGVLFVVILIISLSVQIVNAHVIDFESGTSEYLGIADGSQTGLDITTDFTIELWYKPESLPTTNTRRGLVNKYTSSGSQINYALIHKNVAGQQSLEVLISDTGAEADLNYNIVKNYTFSVDTWYHVAVTYDLSGGSAEFFIDGSSIGSASGGHTSMYNSTADFTISAWDGGNYTDGQMDDIRVWNDIRSSTEIDNNKDNCSLSTSEAGLISWWNFNSNDATDEHANANDLTEYNTPTYIEVALPYECATSTASSTIDVDLDWYSDDLTIISGKTEHYETSSTAPDWTRYHYFHIPFLAWVIIFAGIFVIGSRIILEIIIRFRNGKLR